MRIFIAVLLLVHGLITMAQSRSGFNPASAARNPAWLNWWPTNLGQSWLFKNMIPARTTLGTVTGILWISSGICFMLAVLSLFGFIIPASYWRLLAGLGAMVSLFLFVFYAHPFFLIGIGVNLIVLIAVFLTGWPQGI